FGRAEYRVPKAPSERNKREKGHAFEGYPVDIALFDSPEHVSNPAHLLLIIETKLPADSSGLEQLQVYLSLEPFVKAGIVANNTPIDSLIRFEYKVNRRRGGFEFVARSG